MRIACNSALAAAILLAAAAVRGDEGMWLFSTPPKRELQRRYNFQPPDSWYAHLQRSSVRFNSGGSGVVRFLGRTRADEPSHRH